MNFPGKFEQGSSLSHFSMHADLGSFSLDGHANTVTIPNGHLLFSGDYERSGLDLIVSDHDHRVVIHDYFRGEKRATLVSPEGAPLDPKVIEALTGHDAYAQAAGTAPAAKVVGHVVKMTGSASIVRNGVTIDANNGDTVYQSDVVQTGSGSTLGLVLIDGTTFNLTANARLMLNDLTYDATSSNGSLLPLVSSSNSALFTLVQGAASFVAGQVAKTGDMKIGTPVAVVGIRGTAVNLDIDSVDGKVSISVVDQRDGQVHSVQVFKCAPSGVQGVCTAGDPIGTVRSDGSSLTLTPAANFEVIVQETNKTVDQIAQEFSTFQQVLTTYDIGKQLVPSTPAPSDGRRGDVSPQSTTKFAGSTPMLPSESPRTTVLSDVSNTKSQSSASSISAVATSPIDSGISGTKTSTASLFPALDTTQTIMVNVPSLASVAITSAGGSTNQASQTITGTVDVAYVGTTVTLFDTYNGLTTQLGTSAVGSGGVWTKSVMLTGDGPHSIVAKDTAGGNTSAAVVFTLDTTAPVVAITGSGGPTNQAAQTITGTGEAGTTVILFDNGTQLQLPTVTVGQNGLWSANVTLANGSNSLTATDTDLAGNPATSSAVIYTLSTTGPTLTENLAFDTGSSAADHITANDALSGTGLANPVVHFTIDGSPVAATVTATAQGAWSFTPSGLADGPHTIVASQTDTFGNIGTATLSFTLDTTAPTLAITSLGGSTNQAAQTISGTGEGGNTVILFDNGTQLQLPTVTVGQNGLWSANVTLANGSNSLTATDTDLAGNPATSSAVIYTLSTTGPTLTENLAVDTASASADHITANDALSGTGLANPVGHFTIDGAPVATTVTATAQGAWSFTPSGLADGPHTIVASQTDTFGNIGTATLSFTLDTTAPSLAITS